MEIDLKLGWKYYSLNTPNKTPIGLCLKHEDMKSPRKMHHENYPSGSLKPGHEALVRPSDEEHSDEEHFAKIVSKAFFTSFYSVCVWGLHSHPNEVT